MRLVGLGFDAADPARLAEFWAAALRWEAGQATADRVVLTPADDSGVPIAFVRNAAPKVGQNRVHFDLTTTSPDDQRDTVERLLGLGGSHVDIGQGPTESHVVLADPEGNELCIIDPDNRFLAECGRLGAVNCDGTRQVGQFWSAALGWPLVWDQDEETAIRAADRTGPVITWSGPPLMPRLAKNRIHLHVAPRAGNGLADALAGLAALGARPADIGQGDVAWTVLADPDGNEFCVVS